MKPANLVKPHANRTQTFRLEALQYHQHLRAYKPARSMAGFAGWKLITKPNDSTRDATSSRYVLDFSAGEL